MIVVPNGVDVTGPESRSTVGRRRMITVARAAFQKNPGLWLEVADLAGGAGVDADFVILSRVRSRGDGDAASRHPGPAPGPTDQALARDAHSRHSVPPSRPEGTAGSVGLPVAAATFQAGDAQSAFEALTVTKQNYEQVAERARALVKPITRGVQHGRDSAPLPRRAGTRHRLRTALGAVTASVSIISTRSWSVRARRGVDGSRRVPLPSVPLVLDTIGIYPDSEARDRPGQPARGGRHDDVAADDA